MKTNQLQKNISTEWQRIRLGDYLLHDPDYGINAASVEFSNTLPAYLRITDISEDGKFLTIKKTSVDHRDSKKYVLDDGDVVFARTGASVGKSYLYDKNDGKLVFAGFLIRMKPNTQKLNSAFLSAYTHTSKYEQWVKETSPRSGQPGINSVEYSDLILSVPPLPEQNRIVSVLETWGKAIAKISQKIEAKKQIKKGLMHDLLTGKKRLSGFKDQWENIKVGEIFSFLRTYALSRENLINDTSNNHGIGNIHYGDIHSTYRSSSIDLRNISVPQIKDVDFKFDKEDLLINGDLIMADVSEDYEGIGITVSIHELANKKILGGLHTFVLRDKSKKTTENYRQYIFQNKEIRNRLRKIANGVSVYGISKNSLSKMLLDLPPVLEQIKIANILTAADKEITELERKLHFIKEQKKYLLNNLITGAIRTPETVSTKV